MIDIKNIETKFHQYVSNYDPTNGRIKLKIDHIQRVAKTSRIVAESLNLSEEQINLAIAIGFFHDIGRFEQVRIANTFSDKESKINHGQMSVKVLFENDFIREFIPDNQYDEIIKKAVLNHNRPRIEDGLTDEELLFSKIIRDADKLDIFFMITQEEYTMESIFWYPTFDDQEISEEILNNFKNEHYVSYSKIQKNADVICTFYAYVFNLYFPITRKLVYQNKYLETFTRRIYQTFPSKKVHSQTAELLEYSIHYLK